MMVIRGVRNEGKIKGFWSNLFFFLWVLHSMFTRDFETFEVREYGIGAPKVKIYHELKMHDVIYLGHL